MCMKNRFSKVSRSKVWILILLAVSGVTSSCKDEYLLDDEKPSWLGSSIYEKLQKGQYSYYMKLLADPDVNNAEDADNNRVGLTCFQKQAQKPCSWPTTTHGKSSSRTTHCSTSPTLGQTQPATRT